MTSQYDHHINAILAGASIGSECKKAGVNVNTLRRILIKHPDYEKAKADGKLHTKGIPAKLAALAVDSPAVAEVIAGATLAATALKYDIPAASLAIMVHKANPGISLHHRGKSQEEMLEISMQKAQRTINKTAVAEVMAGATSTAVSLKYGIPLGSLARMIQMAHPGTSLRHRDKLPEELLEISMQKAQRAIDKTRALAKAVAKSRADKVQAVQGLVDVRYKLVCWHPAF